MKFDVDKYEGWRKTILLSYIKRWAAKRPKKTSENDNKDDQKHETASA